MRQRRSSPAQTSLAKELTSAQKSALVALLRAFDYSKIASTAAWQYAEEIGTMYRFTLTNADLRWLMQERLIAHAEEVPSAAGSRQFRSTEVVSFSGRSCFVLTELGERLARQITLDPEATRFAVESGSAHIMPSWNADLRELRLGAKLVKRFRRPAPNQELILSAFEEEHWPVRIDDPLPQQPGRDAPQCLHDTINHLNRAQANPLIHFAGDGTGRGVLWKLHLPEQAPQRHQSGS